MRIKEKILKILSLFIFIFFAIVICSCSTASMNFKKDGSGTVEIMVSKTYESEGVTYEVTKEQIQDKMDDIIFLAEQTSGQDDRVKLKSIKEYDDYYVATLSFMRIQYLSQNNIGGDLGLYTYKDSKDFIQELDSISVLKDYWLYGSYKSLIKFEDNSKYNFANAKFGSSESAIKPIIRSENREMTTEEIDSFFSDTGMLANDKRGIMFTFFLCDIPGLESITFNFKGDIKVYGSKNVENVTKSSITIRPVEQKATISRVDSDPTVKYVDCYAGYVYFTLNPNYAFIGFLSFLGLGLIVLIIIGIIKGFFKRVFTSKKFKLIIRNYDLYLMLLPAMALIFVFSYIPMAGIIIAFKNYKVNDGIFGSEWASQFGLKHFIDLFLPGRSQFGKLMLNTFILALYRFIFGFFFAILLAVLFNYLKDGIFKKSVQTISYFPYFISWVVISTIAYVLLATDGGTINKILAMFGKEPINYYASPQYWRFILTFTYLWKTAGYSTIVYLAAISNIDKSLYEAARIDGAGGFGQFWHVTMPGLTPAIGIQIVFSLGNLVRDDFDQIYTMIRGSALLRDTTDTIGMIVYENIGNPANYSGVGAMGILQGLIALILVVVSNKILKKRGIEGAY